MSEISHDPITLEIIQNSLQATADEMFAAMKKTAMSSIIYEVLDMGTGITDAQGRLAINGQIASGGGVLHVGGSVGLAANAPLALDIKGNNVLVADIPAAHVIGMSMGGSTAISFAGRYPERADGLLLADTTAWYGADAAEKWEARARTAVDKPRELQVPFQADRWFTESFRRRNADEVNRVVGIFLRTSSPAHAAVSFEQKLAAWRRALTLPD